jgi:hypothetical protein
MAAVVYGVDAVYPATASETAMPVPLPNSVCDPCHPLHRQWCVLLDMLQAQWPANGGLGEEDCRRAAAQLLMEVVLRQLGPVDRVQVDGGGNLHVRCQRGQDYRWLWIDGRLATAYRVEEVTCALDEARQAWAIALR